MASILITGGAGFIGSNFVHHAYRRCEDHLITLDRLTYAADPAQLASLGPRHRLIEGDIGDGQLVRELLATHQPRAIVHFAAESHVDRSISGPEGFIATNVVGTFHLLEETRRYWEGLPSPARERFRFLHISTDEVFGSLAPHDPPFSERSPYAPNSPYSASKAASDHLVRAYHHTYGLPTLTTNCSNNYGPRQHPEKLIPLTIANALCGKPLPVYGDGLNVRDWLFVEDHCSAIWQVLERGRVGDTYAIGGGCEKANVEVVHLICQLLDELVPGGAPHEQLIRFVTDRPGHDRRYAIDATKLRTELGWQPRESFASGMQKTVAWYLERRALTL